MEGINNSMGQVETALSNSPVVLDDSITSSVSDIVTEVVQEESKETSTNNSIICLDDEDENLPPLPVCFPVKEKNDKETSKDDKESKDDDFCIVYEKIVPPPDVQVILSNQVEQRSKNSGRKRQKSLTNSDSDQNGRREIIVENLGLDDSVSIIDDECTTSQSTSTKQNFFKQSLVDSTEKKKRKIECAVCFDGPDEIANSKRQLVCTICGHIFCNECLSSALKVCRQCPQCRKRLTVKQYHPIYL